MKRVIVIGGGLAGLAAAAALGEAGFDVDLFEARGFLGGRATSYPLPPTGEAATANDPEVIDNCQHILLRCCVNLLDFYRRIGAEGRIRFHREFYFIEPGGRMSRLQAGRLPAPLHFLGSFLRARYLSVKDKAALIRALIALQREYGRRGDLDRITILDWLKEKRQTPRAIDRFWRQVLVSAVNEDLDRMAARYGFQVFWLGFLARSDSYHMGVPAVPLGVLYSSDGWNRLPTVRLHLRAPVARVLVAGGEVTGVETGGHIQQADFYICCLPFENVRAVLPELELDLTCFSHSPITGIHLWFDRPVSELPHATLLDGTIQWMFNKSQGRYLQLVVSASRDLLELGRQQIIDLAVAELAEYFPRVRDARLEKAHVVKEVRATFSPCPGLEPHRPGTRTVLRNLFLAGDWTGNGWPATMEGAVRSGYIAAEAVTAAAGAGRKFLLPDLA